MTGPAARGTERGTRAPSRLTGTQGAVGAVLVVLALGLALRLIIAYLLPGSGFEVDLSAFRVWAVEPRLGGPQRLLRARLLPRLHAGLSLRPVAGRARRQRRRRRRRPDQDPGRSWPTSRSAGSSGRWSASSAAGDALALAAASWPSSTRSRWFDSVVWGQVDSFGVVFLLLGLRELWRDRPERAAIYTVIAAIIKPQLGILIPIVAVVTIRRALWPVRDPDDGCRRSMSNDRRDGWLARFRAWERRTDHPVRILTTGLSPWSRPSCSACRSACRSSSSGDGAVRHVRPARRRSSRPPAATRT